MSLTESRPRRYPNIVLTNTPQDWATKTVTAEKLRHALAARRPSRTSVRSVRTGITALDDAGADEGFRGGAVHELLWRSACPTTLMLLLAEAAQAGGGGIAWLDPDRELYLPAVAAAGIDLHRLILLRCTDRKQQLWALAECLRCRSVSATVAAVDRLSQIEARRLQLAAECGGGIGILMRPYRTANADYYAAASRWLIEPAAGDDLTQRWSVTLIHGGRTNHALLLEVDRDTRALRASPLLADRPFTQEQARATG